MATDPNRRRRWLWGTAAVAGVAIALVIAVSVTGGDPTPAGAASASAVDVQKPGGSGVGDQAAQFSATTVAGTRIAVPEAKTTVLFFMAAWCAPTLEASALNRIERDLGDKITVLGVDVDPAEPVKDLQAFAGQIGARYSHVHDTTGALTAAFGVKAMDSTVVIDPAGRIVYRDTVPTDEATLRGALAKAATTSAAS